MSRRERLQDSYPMPRSLANPGPPRSCGRTAAVTAKAAASWRFHGTAVAARTHLVRIGRVGRNGDAVADFGVARLAAPIAGHDGVVRAAREQSVEHRKI